jgi:hypothetical protein
MSTQSFSVGKPTLQTALLKYEAFPLYHHGRRRGRGRGQYG